MKKSLLLATLLAAALVACGKKEECPARFAYEKARQVVTSRYPCLGL